MLLMFLFSPKNTDSVQGHGMIQPVVVMKLGGSVFELLKVSR